MRKFKTLALAGALAAAFAISPALSAGFFTNGVPVAGGSQYPTTIPLTGLETIPADTNLTAGLNPQSEAITTAQMAAYGNAQPSRNNILVGGDAGTNLWQRATTGASQTTTVAYGGPDRWAYWSGTGTAMTVTRSATAAALPTGYQQTFRMQRTASQTGVVQMCMAQEVESVNSYQMQGSTVELDFHAYTGANFSPAAPYNMTAYIITGTGSDEGMVNLAYGLNAGGGGSTGWTGQANATAAVISLGGVSTAGRYAAVANIPATATEVAVALCYTPVGTAGTTDAIYFSGIQLVRNPANSLLASTTVGYSCANVACASFERRPQQVETALQQRYFWGLTEGAASVPIGLTGTYDTTTTCELSVQLPVSMRAAPTVTFGGTALSASTWAIIANSATPIALATTYLVQSTLGANTVNTLSLTGTTGAKTAGFACKLVGAAGGSTILVSSEL